MKFSNTGCGIFLCAVRTFSLPCSLWVILTFITKSVTLKACFSLLTRKQQVISHCWWVNMSTTFKLIKIHCSFFPLCTWNEKSTIKTWVVDANSFPLTELEVIVHDETKIIFDFCSSQLFIKCVCGGEVFSWA